jgi:hypothetical protein
MPRSILLQCIAACILACISHCDVHWQCECGCELLSLLYLLELRVSTARLVGSAAASRQYLLPLSVAQHNPHG